MPACHYPELEPVLAELTAEHRVVSVLREDITLLFDEYVPGETDPGDCAELG